MDFDKLDDDLREALQYMRRRGFETVFLVGASMGGTTSLVVAASEDIAGVIAVSPPAQFEGQDALELAPNISEPVLLIASEDDAPSLRFDELLEAAAAAEVEMYVGNDHGTELFAPEREHRKAVQDVILEFLRKHTDG